MRVLVIIPAYNECEAIARVVSELTQSAREMRFDCDYVVVNDGSDDCTGDVLEACSIRHVNLPVNLGIGAAVQTGYMYALMNDYDVAVQMDGDGQHLPAYIPALLEPIASGEADFVIGSRFLENGSSGFRSSSLRRLGIRWLSFCILLCTGTRVSDATSGFRAVGRKGIRLFADRYAKDYPEPESIVQAVKNGLVVREVPVRMAARQTGESSIRLLASVYYMIKVTLAIWLAGMEKPSGKGGEGNL